VDKLLRIKKAYNEHNYDQQLADNYGIDTALYNFKIGIGYAEGRCTSGFTDGDIVHFIVGSAARVKMMGL